MEVLQDITYLLTYLLTPCSTVLLEKLTGSLLVNNFFAFYGTRRFITAFTSAHQCPYEINPVHTPPSHFLKIHFNNIHPSTQFVRLTKFFWVIESRTMRFAGHVACMGDNISAYRVLVGRP